VKFFITMLVHPPFRARGGAPRGGHAQRLFVLDVPGPARRMREGLGPGLNARDQHTRAIRAAKMGKIQAHGIADMGMPASNFNLEEAAAP
jgi:hypothetical protein